MWFESLIRSETGCASYMIGALDSAECVVVDPLWDISPYLRVAAQKDSHIRGADNLVFTPLSARIAEVPFAPQTTVAVVCAGGSSSATAASVLRRHGFSGVLNLAGGLRAWTDAGLPLVDGTGAMCRR
jgi:rhodanese-related sulfurtransferase